MGLGPSRQKLIRLLHALAASIASFAALAQDSTLDRTVDVDVAPQALPTALIEFSRQAGVQILTPAPIVDHLVTPGVHGRMRIGEALSQLLEGTSLHFQTVGAGTIRIESDRSSGGRHSKVEIPVPISGADDHAAVLEEVTVTATKREKSQREIPGSVSSLRGEDLEKMGAQSLDDYLKLVPGAAIAKSQVDNEVVSIRGIVTNILPGFTQSTAGIFLDDMPLSDAIYPQSFPDANPFDLERVEVLKGPQGTLFGAGALGGAVRYITQKPVLSAWQAKLLATATSYGRQSERISPFYAGAINVPLFGDSAALRVAGLYRKDQGRIDVDASQRHEKDVDQIRQITGRALATWSPLDGLKLDAMYFKQDTRQADWPFTDQTHTFTRKDTPFASPRNSNFGGANFSASYTFDWATLLSSSNFIRKNNFLQTEGSRAAGAGTFGTPNPDGGEGGTDGPGAEDTTTTPILQGSNTTHNKIFAEELRLTSAPGGRWEWVAGGAYMRSRQYLVQLTQVSPLATSILEQPFSLLAQQFPLSTPIGTVVGERDAEFEYASVDANAVEKALFAEVTRKLGEHWELTAGARLFHTHLDTNDLFDGPQALAFFGTAEFNDRQHVDAKGVNPKFAVRYRHNAHVQTYVLVSKGFQFGGVQLNPPNVASTTSAMESGNSPFKPYRSSKLWNYEWGVRTDWFRHRLQVDATAFYLDWKDLQLTELAPVVGSAVTTVVIANVGRAHSNGAEVAIRMLPISGLTLTSSAAFLHAVTDVPFLYSDGTTIAPGTRLPGTPRIQLANVLAYETSLPFGTGWSTGINLTQAYGGKAFNDLEYSGAFGGYSTVDARVHLLRSATSMQPDLSLSLNNAFDKRGLAGISTAKGARQKDFYLINPRTLLLSLSLRF